MKRNHLLLCLTLTLFLLFSSFITFFQKTVWWDSAVYIGMGKYYWSFGESGLLEISRPPMLPLLLGFGWKIGIDTIFLGKILSILFSLGTIFMAYLVARKLFSEETGLLGAFFVAFSQTFLFFSHHALSEIPSAFFLLLGILLLLESRLFYAGVVFGLCFLTRFYQGIAIVLVIATYLLFSKEKHHWIKESAKILAGLLTVVLPYLTLVWLFFGDALYPFALQRFLSIETGIIYSQPWWFYLAQLTKENFLLLSLFALPLFWKRKNTILALLPSLALLLLYSVFSHKEMRLLLPFLPLLLIGAAHTTYGLFMLINDKMLRRAVSFLLLGGWLALSLHGILPLLTPSQEIPVQERFFQDYLKDAEGNIWISSPKFALYSDAKISGLAYYPFPEGSPDVALINTCDLEGNSEEYSRITQDNINIVQTSLKNTYSSIENGCEYSIYERITSLS